jgi:dihydroflavonol-4-reductase
MVLVTGATGLVGSRLIYDLLKKGEQVRALKRNTSSIEVIESVFSNELSLLEKIEWVIGDINDIFSLEDAMNGIDEVYHSAALISFQKPDRDRMMKINAEGTANMVNLALEKGIKAFCFISSVAALGRGDQSDINELSEWQPSKKNSNYAVSKYCAEREVWRAAEEGLNVVIVNPTIIIGPGNWNSGSAQMFPSIWKGLRYFTTGTTGFVDVRDVSKAAILLMEKKIYSRRFIINSENASYEKIFSTIAESFGKIKPKIKVNAFLAAIGWRMEALRAFFSGKSPMITCETARNSLETWRYSNNRLVEETGFTFIPIEQSIRDTAEIFLLQKR